MLWRYMEGEEVQIYTFSTSAGSLQGEEPRRWPLNRRLGGAHRWSAPSGQRNKFIVPVENRTSDCPVYQYLCRLSDSGPQQDKIDNNRYWQPSFKITEQTKHQFYLRIKKGGRWKKCGAPRECCDGEVTSDMVDVTVSSVGYEHRV